MPEAFKVAEPKKFDGMDMSLSTVTAWEFSTEEYMELASVPEEIQTHLASAWLSGDMKVWYINTYKISNRFPPSMSSSRPSRSIIRHLTAMQISSNLSSPCIKILNKTLVSRVGGGVMGQDT